MRHRPPAIALAIAATLSLALVVPVFAAGKKKPAAKAKSSASPTPTPAPELIEVTGRILGVTLFTSLEGAREKMERYKIEQTPGASGAENTEEKETGERVIWRLAETEYQWIVAWANKEGKVVKISASLRPEKKKPFREIGDLGRAKAHTDSMALWITEHGDGTFYRLIAKGTAEEASTIYMYSLKREQFR